MRTYFVIEGKQPDGGSLSRHFVAGGGSGRGWRTALRLWLLTALETRSFQRMRTPTASAAPTRIHPLPDPPARHDWRERESIQHASLGTSANLKDSRGPRTVHLDFHTTSMSEAHSFYPGNRRPPTDHNAEGVVSPGMWTINQIVPCNPNRSVPGNFRRNNTVGVAPNGARSTPG